MIPREVTVTIDGGGEGRETSMFHGWRSLLAGKRSKGAKVLCVLEKC